MREIKFRVWSKTTKKFVNNMRDLVITTDGAVYEVFGDEILCVLTKYVEVVQYTGLKDKNGVEIYEGGIISWKDRLYDTKKKKWIDEYVGGNVVVEWCEKTLTWVCRELNGYCENLTDYADSDVFDVIGNIYENPELLEAQK